MFEDLIVQLDQMGVQYTEDYDMGTLTIDVGAIDKINLIQVIQLANDSGLEFTVDEAFLIIQTGGEPVVDEFPEPDDEAELANLQAGAMDELF